MFYMNEKNANSDFVLDVMFRYIGQFIGNTSTRSRVRNTILENLRFSKIVNPKALERLLSLPYCGEN